ncbi:stress response protein NST1-like [Papaver somniferum]|uniref:stress response protein NST1-like n=1 Tax=Papaver somniferum TaxID=3469 RepID=UPI000E6F9CBF|nr:stress response protein NST1-like [Papaver somniferum]
MRKRRVKHDLLAKKELARKEEEEQKQRELQEDRERAKKDRSSRRKENLDQRTRERQEKRVKELREGLTRVQEEAAEKERIQKEVDITVRERIWGCNDLASVLRQFGFSVPPSATSKEILNFLKKAHFKFHPDKTINFPLYERIEAEEKMKIIQNMTKLENGD